MVEQTAKEIEPFEISAFEAFLIGTAIGDHFNANGTQSGYFFDSLRNCLSPYCESFLTSRTISIPFDDVPTDVSYTDYGGMLVGKSPSQPHLQFFVKEESSETAWCACWNTDRKSLVDLLGILLMGTIALSPEDMTRTAIFTEEKLADWTFREQLDTLRIFVQLAKEAQADGSLVLDPENNPLHRKRGHDNESKVRERLSELARASGWLDYYTAGEQFGRIRSVAIQLGDFFVGGCDDFGQSVAMIAESVKKLLDQSLIKSYHNLSADLGILHGRLDYVMEQEFDPDFPPLVTQPSLEAFGHMLGLAGQVDQMSTRGAGDVAVPRTFRDLFDASGDKLRSAIKEAERELNEAGPNRITPEKVVRYLGVGVEAIVKRTWPNSIQGDQTVYPVLTGKLRTGTVLERRMSSIGLTLYMHYRNPSHHDITFACSYDEACLFLWSLRAMLKLSEQINPG